MDLLLQKLLYLLKIPCIDINNPMSSRHIRMNGEVSSLINPPAGCLFAKCCRYAKEKCLKAPPFVEVAPGHFVACHCVCGK